MTSQHTRLLRTTGLTGVAAATVMITSDCLIMDSSTSGADLLHGWLDRFTASPNWRLRASGVLAPIGGLLFTVGFVHVFLALNPAGKVPAFVSSALMAIGYNILAAWHCAAPMFAHINQTQPGSANPVEHEGWKYLEFLGFAGFVPIFLGLVILPILIAFCKTLYPRWFCAVTPLVLYMVVGVTFRFLPAPIGGYMVISSGSISLLLFFVLSTMLLWRDSHGIVPDRASA